jgi:hypothetical protein
MVTWTEHPWSPGRYDDGHLVRYALFWLVLGVILLGLLALATAIVAAFSKRSAPMSRLRALIRDLHG